MRAAEDQTGDCISDGILVKFKYIFPTWITRAERQVWDVRYRYGGWEEKQGSRVSALVGTGGIGVFDPVGGIGSHRGELSGDCKRKGRKDIQTHGPNGGCGWHPDEIGLPG